MKRAFRWVVDHALTMILGALAVVVILAGLVNGFADMYTAIILPGGMPTQTQSLSAFSMVFLVGLLLARVRYKQLKLYGLLQIFVGGVAAWSLSKGARTQDTFANFAALMTVTYLIGRGFFDEGEQDWKRVARERRATEENMTKFMKRLEESRKETDELHRETQKLAAELNEEIHKLKEADSNSK